MSVIDQGRLRERLTSETEAEVRFDLGSRGLYSTDASLYQIEPTGVVIPRTKGDVARAVKVASESKISIVARGSATSLSGQTIGDGLIFDLSKYLNRIGIVDKSRMTVKVEPGVVLDQLNAFLKPMNMMFGPDVSTSDRATLGGMIGNNSAGARSLKYGKTVDHVRSLDVILSDGIEATFGPVSPEELETLCRREDRLGKIYRTTRDVVKTHEAAIRERFPKILRRVSGYNLDELIPGCSVRAPGWVDEPWQFNLARLLVGSEGTLAVMTGAEVRVMPIPPAQGLVVLSFATIPAALDRLEEIVATGPAAVEMLDRMIIELAASNPGYAKYVTFAEGRPAAVLAAQFYADSQEELETKTGALMKLFEGRPNVLGMRRSLIAATKDDFWKVRKAGFSLLMAMLSDAKPVAFVEDTAVSPAKLPAFYARFEEIIERQGLKAAVYGHADVGCLHIRPIINVKSEEGVEQLRTIAREVSDLVAEFGGAMSGEHGDGLARSGWNRKLFGDEIYKAFEQIKNAFDPDHILNPGKVVAQPDPGSNLRLGPETYHTFEPESTILDFSGQGGYARAIEMCSGVGSCRKTGSGTMCPSYMVTRDEDQSTRGRANGLRMMLAGQIPDDDATVAHAMDLCLQCKACKTECPSGVDMAKIKVEYLYQSNLGKMPKISHLLLGNIHTLSRLGSATAPIANWSLRQPWFKWLLEKFAGIEARRSLPTFAQINLKQWFKKHQVDPRAGSRGKVVLMDDCFTTYNNPEVGQAAVRVLEAAGYTVELAGIECCGRAAISKGLLPQARLLARSTLDRLIGHAKSGTPILGCEPSCLLTLVDEYKDFRLGPDAEILANAAKLVDSFVAEIPDLPLNPWNQKILVHGHCQQKALVGTGGSVAALKRIPELLVQELDSGCCGMAGSFGYEVGHYDMSVALANRVLIPAAKADPEAKIAAPGFSCRSQLHGLEGIEAMHPIEMLAEHIKSV